MSPHDHLARPSVRPLVRPRPPFRGELLRATENHHRAAVTDRPTDRRTEFVRSFVRWHVVQRQLLQRASQGRGRRGTREEGGTGREGGSYRCGYVSWPTTPRRRPLLRSALLRFRRLSLSPSVRAFPSARSMDHLTSVRPAVNARSSSVRRNPLSSPPNRGSRG